jgi:uncharacterized protein
MFSRRHPRTRRQKLRELLWPSMGMKRLMVYYRHRMGRLPGTPEFIARGMALGVAISFTPLVGLHMFIGAGLCVLLRASLLAMVLGTFIGGNLWTLPVIWIASYNLGGVMLGQDTAGGLNAHALSFRMLMEHPLDLLLPMAAGCVPMVAAAWIGAYYPTRAVVRRYKEARRARIRHRTARDSA